jgi:hypothetical protein
MILVVKDDKNPSSVGPQKKEIIHTPIETGGTWLIFIILLMVGILSSLFPEKKNDK